MQQNVNYFDYLEKNTDQFLDYMKEKYPVYYNSNIFVRDIQYGIKNFLEKKGMKITYRQMEELSAKIIERFEKKSILRKLSDKSWLFIYKTEPVNGNESEVAPVEPSKSATAEAAAEKTVVQN